MDSNQLYRNLGQRIRDLRKSLRLTQERLAQQVGISRASLANIEAGRQQVLVHHFLRLASALQLDSPELLLLAPREQPPTDGTFSALPLTGAGLTEKQRREVLNLMGNVLENNKINAGGEDR